MPPLRGWPAAAAALGAGLAAGLAHPPFGLLVGLVGYAAMLRLGDDSPSRRGAFLRGWLAGVGYFAVSVWWVVEPFMVDAANQGWMAPIALVLMASGLALFWGLALLLYRMTGARGPTRVLVFAGALALAEWLRGHLFTGFPWNLPGESWRAGSAMSQTAALVGAYGLTWITVALAAAPALAFDAAPRRTRGLALGCAALIAAGLCGWGAWRVTPPPAAADPPVVRPMIRIVQANIDQKEKWRPENLEQVFATYLELTTRPARVTPDVVVWPEGALPAVIDDLLAPGSIYAARLAGALGQGQMLMLGANRAGLGSDGGTEYFNSLVALRRAPGGLQAAGVYDKHRLVPFGEFMPAGAVATRLGVRSLVHMPDDFTAGPLPVPMAPAGLPALQPMICYEALFPGFTRAAARRGGVRPSWILNVSNDAWFGVTSGPLQHLNIASYRAIEEGLPMIRATPTGVSAVIDGHGRVIGRAQLALGKIGVIDARLPPRLQLTLYSRWGEAFFTSMLLVSALCIAAFRR